MTDSIIPKTEKRSLRYDFSAVEIHDLALNLANKTKELAAVEEEKKSVTSQYAAKVNEAKASCNKLSNQVADGYEIRDVECDIEFHKPKEGMKTLIRKDNSKIIEEKMSDWEFNLFNQPDDKATTQLHDEERDKLQGNTNKKGKGYRKKKY